MGTLVLAGATSGSATLTPVDAVTAVITLPSATATLATLGANTFVGNQAITGTLSATGVASLAAGAVGAPGLYLGADTTTGLYRIGANNDGFAVSGAKVLDISATGLGVTGTLSTTGAITEIPRCAVYQWTDWNPVNVSGGSTNASSTAVATSTAASYVTMANSSGTLTFTFVKAGVYNITMVGGLSVILAGITRVFMAFTLGGSSTRFISTSPRRSENHDEPFDVCFNVSVLATASQTFTILPSTVLTGGGTTTSFYFYATASAAYMGTP